MKRKNASRVWPSTVENKKTGEVVDFIRKSMFKDRHDPYADHRAEAAQIATETARWERGERGRLKNPADDGILAEFPSEQAWGLASYCALKIADAFKAQGIKFKVDMPWHVAGQILAAGWQPQDGFELQDVSPKASA